MQVVCCLLLGIQKQPPDHLEWLFVIDNYKKYISAACIISILFFDHKLSLLHSIACREIYYIRSGSKS